MSHPPPLLPSEELENLQQQNQQNHQQHRKPNNWNNSNSSLDMDEMEDGPRGDQWNGPSLLGLAGPGPFMGNRPPFNFRGRGNRGINPPYMPRGRGRGAPRGGIGPIRFRGNGNFRGRGGSW